MYQKLIILTQLLYEQIILMQSIFNVLPLLLYRVENFLYFLFNFDVVSLFYGFISFAQRGVMRFYRF